MLNTWNNILNEGYNQPNLNADIQLSNKISDGQSYFSITLKRLYVDENNSFYNNIDTEHFLNGISAALLKEKRYPLEIIQWFNKNIFN